MQERGELLQLIEITSDGESRLNERVLGELCRVIGDKPVAIFSTAGKFRQGKTFWKNVLLRGLQKGRAEFLPHEVIGGEDGFTFKAGFDRHTQGIMVWSKVFFMRDKMGDEIAVLIIDTQGTYDLQTDTSASAVIFSLSMLMSSKQVFNIVGHIDAQEMDSLNYFIEFSKSQEDKVGQHFVILVRNALQGCGLKAGNAYLQRVQQTMNSVENLGKMMNVLMNGFDRVECFLAPTPGSKVANADGAIAAEDCEKEFLNSLCELANYMISDLEPKTFKDVPLTGKTLMNYVKQLVTHIHIVHKETRGIGNAFEAISRLQFEKAKNSAIAWFNTECEALFARNGYQAMLPKLLAEELDRIKELTMKDYNAAPRFGNARNKAEYEKSFRESIEQKCQQKYEHNDQRYRDSKVATLIQEAYAKYEAEMRPDLALSLGDESRLQKIQQKHPVARSMALGHYDNGVSDLGNLSLIGQKREALSKMIDVK